MHDSTHTLSLVRHTSLLPGLVSSGATFGEGGGAVVPPRHALLELGGVRPHSFGACDVAPQAVANTRKSGGVDRFSFRGVARTSTSRSVPAGVRCIKKAVTRYHSFICCKHPTWE